MSNNRKEIMKHAHFIQKYASPEFRDNFKLCLKVAWAVHKMPPVGILTVEERNDLKIKLIGL